MVLSPYNALAAQGLTSFGLGSGKRPRAGRTYVQAEKKVLKRFSRGRLLTIPGSAASLVLAVLLALDTTAMVRFVRNRTPVNPTRPATRLVTDGPYRFTRNPMYLGMAGAYIGIAVATGVLWALALLPVVVILMDRLVIPREERHLAQTFGEEYERYRGRVRRWL